jgi:four helix bundle protein
MSDEQWANYEEWLRQVPEVLIQDPLWDLETYRKALFFSDLAWHDCEKLDNHSIGKHLVSQLLKSAGSSSANIEEGYGRGFGKDYARFLRIALGSTREARGWYYRNRHALDSEMVHHRMKLATELIRNLTILANQQRRL